MPLVDLDLLSDSTTIPWDVRSFLREANRRIERFQIDCRVPGFVPSDFESCYATLRALSAAGVAKGNLFCEWGSGFGVVACLAAMLDFDAYGIEIEAALVDAARQLADDFDLPVEFGHGSFIPPGGESYTDTDSFAWLTTDAGRVYDELGIAPDDFDIIFAYPWPDEEALTQVLFERYARAGAVLVSYHGDEALRVRRKRARKPARR
jgi:hypothetical protein